MKLLVLSILFLFELAFSQPLKCNALFSKQESQETIDSTFLQLFPNKKKIDKIINLAFDFNSDGSISSTQAKRFFEKLLQSVTEINILPELKTEYLTNLHQELKQELETEIKNANEKISKGQRSDFFSLYKISRKSTYLFQYSDSSLNGYLKIFKRAKSNNLDNLRNRFIQILSKKPKFNEANVDKNIEDLKITIENNPRVKVFLTFDSIDKLDIYKLLRHRIFVLGLTEVPVFADDNVLFQETFLLHDESHLYAFLDGATANGALFKPSNAKDDSYDKETEWKKLEQKFQILEQKLANLFIQGKIKNQKVIVAVLFDLYHEAFEPIYKKLNRSSENNLSVKQSVLELFNSNINVTEDLDTIIEVVNSVFL